MHKFFRKDRQNEKEKTPKEEFKDKHARKEEKREENDRERERERDKRRDRKEEKLGVKDDRSYRVCFIQSFSSFLFVTKFSMFVTGREVHRNG